MKVRLLTPLLRLVSTQWRVLSMLTLSLITALSLMPVAELPSVPGTDKTSHILAYSLLMLPVALHRPKYWLWIALFFLGWSGAIELMQPYVNRYAEWLDMLANGTGLLCGILIGGLLHRHVSSPPE